MTSSINIAPRVIRGAVLEQPGAPRPYARSQPLEICTLELQAPQKSELLIRITAASICHSDLSVINNERPRPVPMLLGHEAAGVVEQVGPDVTDLKKGDSVVLTFLPRCGACRGCESDGKIPCEKGTSANLAGTLLGGESRLQKDGEQVWHHGGISGFATHAVVSRESVVSVSSDIPPEIAAVLGCAFLTGGGALINVLKPNPEDSVAVVGLGGVGIASIITAAALGIREIIGIDTQDIKREMALQLGATSVMTPEEALAANHRFSGVIEAAGHPQAVETAWNLTAPGGITCSAGIPPLGSEIRIDPVQLTTEARQLIGSYLGSADPQVDIPFYADLWRAGKLNVEGLISRRLELHEINEAMDQLIRGDVLRQVIIFSEEF